MTWNQLLASALVGTDRRPVTLDPEPALAGVLPSGPLDAPALLHAAGALALAGRATGAATPAPAVDPFLLAEGSTEAPLVGRLGTERLAGLLSGPASDDNLALVREWLAVCVRAGRRVPPDLLPMLLDVAGRRRDLRADALAAGGPRAVWLAAQDDRWAWAVRTAGGPATADEAPPSDHTGVPQPTPGEQADGTGRAAYLARLRRYDPAAGRAWLERTWSDHSVSDLALLVEALGEQLSAEDEPWLERALDRGVRARRAAVLLLRRLPGSAFADRMRQRVAAWAGSDVGTLRLSLPTALDKAAERDGMVRKPPTGLGERAWWFEQLVAAAPLDVWEPWGGAATVIDRPLEPGLGRELRRGLATVAAGAGDAALARALLSHPRTARDVEPEALDELLGLLDPAELDTLVPALLGASGEIDLARLLARLPEPWSEPVTVAVLRTLGEVDRNTTWPGSRAHVTARRLDPSALPLVEEMCVRYPTSHALVHVATTLTTRAQLRAEIEEI